MRFVLAGNERIGCECLKTLLGEKQEVVGVITDKSNGKSRLDNEKIKFMANQAGIKLYEVEDINHPDVLQELRQLKPEVIFNVAFLQLYKPPILMIPSHGCINFHPGPLPKYGGSNGWVWAIINGEREYGVTFHYMEERIDAGHVVGLERFEIEKTETGLSLLMKCYEHGVALFKKTLTSLLEGTVVSVPQDPTERSYYYNKVPYEGMIDAQWSAVKICNFVRAMSFSPFPNPLSPAMIAFNGEKLRVTDAIALGDTVANQKNHGEVIDITEEGLVMRTGDGPVLLTLSDNSKPFKDTAGICAAKGICKGHLLG